jgi:hypothetical protein
VLQVSALSWFLLSNRVLKARVFLAHAIHRRPERRTRCLAAAASYEGAIETWVARIDAARLQVRSWRLAALCSMALMVSLAFSVAEFAAGLSILTHVVGPHQRELVSRIDTNSSVVDGRRLARAP